MAIERLTDKDGSIDILRDKTVAVLGYGSQGHAHALNLRDSGVKVIVAELKGTKNYDLAVQHGFQPMSIPEAIRQCDLFLMTLPDELQPEIYEKSIRPHLRPGQCFGATHGFNIHFKTIVPPKDIDVVMVAPKGPGHLVRSEFERGGGVPCLLCVHQNATGKARDIALAWAIGIGAGRAGILVTTFKDETETDLFGEQCVLCGGLSALIKAGFETLVKAGYPPEIAYYEVCHEMKLIVDLIVRGGLTFMRYSISNTAEFGDYYMGPKIINAAVKKQMRQALKDIQSGKFAKKFRADYAKGFVWFKKQREKEKKHPIEIVGKQLRRMMPWINPVEM